MYVCLSVTGLRLNIRAYALFMYFWHAAQDAITRTRKIEDESRCMEDG